MPGSFCTRFIESLESRIQLANVTSGFVDETLVTGLKDLTTMTFAPDGRLFILQQDGKIKVYKNGAMLATPAITLTVSTPGERGVLGLAFDPDFASNSHVYIYYTASGPAHNRLSRFTMTGDTINPASETTLIDFEELTSVYHNSGTVRFGPDGKLYVSVGENARASNSQNMTTLLGKILRLNKDGTIPTDNPFYNDTTGQARMIYHLGLRNPFSFGINPTDGRLFVNDVGQDTWEEVNTGPAGSNFGWPSEEGPEPGAQFTTPWYSYNHSTGGCAVIGGPFYPASGGSFPSNYAGKYLVADHCIGWIRALDPVTGAVAGTISTGGITALTDIDVAPDGSLYYLERTYVPNGGGKLGRIRFNNNGAPAITSHPQSQTKDPGQSVTFTVAATGAAPLSYQWQRNRSNISGATNASYTITSVVDGDNSSKFRCIVTNASGSITSDEAILTITGQQPVPVIDLPAPGTNYRAGETITYSGTGTDPQDGTLTANKFTWQVDFHHDTHIHPFVPATTGAKSGTFVIPDTGEPSNETWYRIYLTVKDSQGNLSTTYREIFPRKSKVTLATNVAGLKLTLDSTPQDAPHIFTGVEGFKRTIGAPASQVIGGITYVFTGWSDGGAAEHVITTPTADTTYTAVFAAQGTSGTGITATYFNNRDFTGTTVSRVDPNINFDFEDGSPDALITRDTFSARWTGKIRPAFSETYKFYAYIDDGARVWVNNQLVIDRWRTGSATEYSGSIALSAGQLYDIKVEFFEETGNATCQLRWSSPNTPKAFVPTSALFPASSTTVAVTDDVQVRGGSNANTNYGNLSNLQVKYSPNIEYQRESYLKFDLTSLTTINQAKLRMFGKLSQAETGGIGVNVFGGAGNNWDESLVTWNTRPGSSGSAIAARNITSTTGQWWEWDVTSYLKAQKALGRTSVTLVLKASVASTAFVQFNSSELGTNAPELRVS